jgi:hypothetical protein
MSDAPGNGQRIYLRGGLDGDPLSFSIRWFVPAGFEACLALLGVSALAVMIGDVSDGTPVFETRACTAVSAAEHVVRDLQRSRGIAYSQTVFVDATPEEVYRRIRLWDSARLRWAQ